MLISQLSPHNAHSGFTVLELLITMIIAVVVISFGGAVLTGSQDRGNAEQLLSRLERQIAVLRSDVLMEGMAGRFQISVNGGDVTFTRQMATASISTCGSGSWGAASAETNTLPARTELSGDVGDWGCFFPTGAASPFSLTITRTDGEGETVSETTLTLIAATGFLEVE